MRFGLISICDNDPASRPNVDFYQELLDQIVLAEELGFDDYWIAEHHYSNYGVVPSPAMILAAAATRTHRIGLGSGVSILPFSSPMRVAEDYAMVDLLSKGRLVFGVGRGFLIHEFDGFGIADEAESRERFDEALTIILKAWEGQRFTFHGKHFHVDDLKINVLPVQQPCPPVFMAALSPSSYEKAAMSGIPVTGVVTTLRTMDAVKERLDTFKRLYAKAGHDPTALEIPMTWYATVVSDRDRTYEEGGRHLINYFRNIGNVFDPSKVSDENVRKVYERLHEWNTSVTWEQIDSETDVALIGTAEQVIEKVTQAKDAGVGKIQLFMNFGNRSHAEVANSMRLFAEEVMPAFE